MSSLDSARVALVAAFGRFCSYCELALPNPAVEHVIAKSQDRRLEWTWDNLLLACPYCNGTKSGQPTTRTDFVWPDLHNSALAFEFSLADRTIVCRRGLSPQQECRATNTVRLTGLALTDGGVRDESRRRALTKARYWRRTSVLDADDLDAVRLDVQAFGHWSVWCAVFHDMPEVLRLIHDALPGTARECFDADFGPTDRVRPL